MVDTAILYGSIYVFSGDPKTVVADLVEGKAVTLVVGRIPLQLQMSGGNVVQARKGRSAFSYGDYLEIPPELLAEHGIDPDVIKGCVLEPSAVGDVVKRDALLPGVIYAASTSTYPVTDIYDAAYGGADVWLVVKGYDDECYVGRPEVYRGVRRADDGAVVRWGTPGEGLLGDARYSIFPTLGELEADQFVAINPKCAADCKVDLGNVPGVNSEFSGRAEGVPGRFS